MLSLRIARLDTLIARAGRPGGIYPALWLGTRALSPDERAEMDGRLTRSPLGAAWSVWRDPARSVADRAFALAETEPAFAHVHLLLADVWLRDADVRAEPHPEIRKALATHRRALGRSYARLLVRLGKESDSDAERHATARGFNYVAEEAHALLARPEEQQCCARGFLAWSPDAPEWVCRALAHGERAELRFDHRPDGVRAALTGAEFTGLECPELLTDLRLEGRGVASALQTLDRVPSLRSLEFRLSPSVAAAAVDARALGKLPIESLALTLPQSTRGFPSWVAALPALRALRLCCEGPLDIPEAVSEVEQLTSLEIDDPHTLPASLGRLVGLRSLKVSGWRLTGLPASLVELSQLEKLAVDPVLELPGVPDGFERLRALREVRLGHLTTPELPPALYEMPWLSRVELISGRIWPDSQVQKLKSKLPGAHVDVAFTGNAR